MSPNELPFLNLQGISGTGIGIDMCQRTENRKELINSEAKFIILKTDRYNDIREAI